MKYAMTPKTCLPSMRAAAGLNVKGAVRRLDGVLLLGGGVERQEK